MDTRAVLDYARLLPRLGVANVAAVVRYRRQMRRGYFASLLPARSVEHPQPLWEGEGQRAAAQCSPALRAAILARAAAIGRGEFMQFGSRIVDEGVLPQWFKGVYVDSRTQHFSQVAVNAVAGEDVKTCWDLSRFHWVSDLVLAAAVSDVAARAEHLARLHQLTTHWLAENDYQRGVNWACAHEVSVRGMQLLLSSLILEEQVGLRPSAQLLELLQQSWQRVRATQAYGRAQMNNHSLAEHVFLIYAAAFLAKHGVAVASSEALAKLHRALPRLMEKLILPDGGCNMYSTNYHRVFCEMVAFAKIFDDAFSVGIFVQPRLQQKVAQLAAFLEAMIDPISGKAPLLGHNDGSLHSPQFTDFSDYEPSLLLLTSVMGLPVPARCQRAADAVWLFGYTPHFVVDVPPADYHFDDFGLLILARGDYRAYLKYPRNRFRPAQMDFLHLDLWVGGVNILHDSGTFSYNAATADRGDGLSDPQAHNVPLLLEVPLLKKFSPFLYRYWPQARVQKLDADQWEIVVGNGAGVVLHRTMICTPARTILRDMVEGGGAWGVAFRGAVAEGGQPNMATLSDRAVLRFDNLQHFSIVEVARAANYHAMVPTQRLIATPCDPAAPLETTFEWIVR